MKYFEQCNNSLILRNNGETVVLLPWGNNSFRVLSTFLGDVNEDSIALLAPE